MGVINRKKESKPEWSEEQIQNDLRRHFMSESNIKFVAENLFIYEWESDLWFLTKANIAYEIEIKITKADFKNDFKKQDKHIILETKDDKKKILKPNFFYYAVPENLIDVSEIPEYAGLIYMKEYFPYFDVIKSAPKLTTNKFDEQQLNLLEKFYYNYRQWKTKTMIEKQAVNDLNDLIDSYQEKPEGEKKTYTKLLEENKNTKLLLQEETDKAERYYKFWSQNQDELTCQRYVIRELMGLLKDNKIPFDIGKIEDSYYEDYGKKNMAWPDLV